MINRILLVGRLTKNPDLRYTPNGVAVATFTLAVNRTFANQQGERETDFINCVIWRKQAENVANFLKKGSLAGVDGRLNTRNFEGQDGKRVYVTEVVAENVQFLDTRNSSESQQNTGAVNTSPSYKQQSGHVNDDDPFAQGNQVDFNDDDLPF